MSSLKAYRAFSWFTLLYCVGVILWGAYVRATGSGAGCGSHWPLCNGQVLPRAERIQTIIEFSHRLSSGLSLLFVLVLFVWTWRLFVKGSFQRKAAALSLLAIILEALVGAMLVLLRLVEHDQSVDRAISISLHLVNTLFLLGVLTVTAIAAGESRAAWLPKEKKERYWIYGLLAGFALLGALGALTALGDTLFPATSLGEGLSRDLEKRHFLERIRIFHPIIALAWFGGPWVWLARVQERDPELKRLVRGLMAVVLTNLGLGLLNVLLLAPIWMQIVHLLVADILWILFVSLVFSLSCRWRS